MKSDAILRAAALLKVMGESRELLDGVAEHVKSLPENKPVLHCSLGVSVTNKDPARPESPDTSSWEEFDLPLDILNDMLCFLVDKTRNDLQRMGVEVPP